MSKAKALSSLFVAASVCTLVGCAAEPPADPNAGATRVETVQPEGGAETTAPASESPEAEPTPEVEFDRSTYSIDQADSLWVIANKTRPLNPLQFAPPDLVNIVELPNANGQPLRQEAKDALVEMSNAASAQGIQLSITSAYRSYDNQVATYNGFVNRDGQEAADTYSARPGYSEHQTGWTVDLDDGTGCNLNECFANAPGGQWLAANAADYGFVLRYPFEKTNITGYIPEPWHYRYVGVELAQAMRDSGTVTLEEFFGLPAAPTYP